MSTPGTRLDGDGRNEGVVDQTFASCLTVWEAFFFFLVETDAAN